MTRRIRKHNFTRVTVPVKVTVEGAPGRLDLPFGLPWGCCHPGVVRTVEHNRERALAPRAVGGERYLESRQSLRRDDLLEETAYELRRWLLRAARTLRRAR